MIPRLDFLRLATGTAALPAVSRIARAQTYPTRAVTLPKLGSRSGISRVHNAARRSSSARCEMLLLPHGRLIALVRFDQKEHPEGESAGSEHALLR